jgi:hypothetical protein
MQTINTVDFTSVDQHCRSVENPARDKRSSLFPFESYKEKSFITLAPEVVFVLFIQVSASVEAPAVSEPWPPVCHRPVVAANAAEAVLLVDAVAAADGTLRKVQGGMLK